MEILFYNPLPVDTDAHLQLCQIFDCLKVVTRYAHGGAEQTDYAGLGWFQVRITVAETALRAPGLHRPRKAQQ